MSLIVSTALDAAALAALTASIEVRAKLDAAALAALTAAIEVHALNAESIGEMVAAAEKQTGAAPACWKIDANGEGTVNFVDASGGIVFHFDMRRSSNGTTNQIVMNTHPAGGSWQTEERIAYDSGRYEITIRMNTQGFEVSWDDNVKHLYRHRVSSATIVGLKTRGGACLLFK